MIDTRRMARRPEAVRSAAYAKLTDAQRTARTYGFDLSAEDAEAFLHSEYYARLAFLRDRDALTFDGDQRQEHREYRRAVVAELATPFGRARRLIRRRGLERPPSWCPF